MAPRMAVVGEAGLRPELSLLNNQQSRYEYRLLVTPASQLTRDILPITIRDGAEQAQTGEFTECDDDWFRPIGRGRETLRQRLIQALPEGTILVTAAGTEHTEWVELETFPESVAPFASNKEDEAKKARRHTN